MMSFKYQLICLGDIRNKSYEEIREVFLDKVKDLGIQQDAIEVICASDINKYSNKQPTFAFYLGCKNNSGVDANILEQLIKNGDVVFPLYFENFEDEIPNVIKSMNGTLYISEKVSAVVNCALESFRLLRKSRRVFISYKRSESTGVAQQLFDLLIRNGFDPFLDSYSIRPADNFQEELLHRMTDSDVLIQLYTPEFFESQWCKIEVEEANLKQIGVVVLLWPDVELKPFSHLVASEILTEDCFNERQPNVMRTLKSDIANKVVKTVESIRARNLAARQDSICGEFVAEGIKYDKHIIREYSYLLEKDMYGNNIRLFIPAIGIPHAYDCYESRAFRRLLDTDGLEIYLLYDSLRIRKQWIEHLDWLNESLDVKTIKRKDFELWISQH